MRVIVAYAPGLLHPRVVPSLTQQGYPVETVECVNIVGHPQSYPAVLLDAFRTGACIIEHDVESRPGFLAALEECPESCCFFAYDFRVSFEDAVQQPTVTSAPLGVDFAPLGHTRIREDLGAELVAMLETDPLFSATWVARDVHVTAAMARLGVKPHRHPGKAFHHHDYGEPGVPDDLTPMG